MPKARPNFSRGELFLRSLPESPSEFFALRHRVVSALAKRLTTREPFYSEPKTACRAVTFDGFVHIRRASGKKSATLPERGRNKPLVKNQCREQKCTRDVPPFSIACFGERCGVSRIHFPAKKKIFHAFTSPSRANIRESSPFIFTPSPTRAAQISARVRRSFSRLHRPSRANIRESSSFIFTPSLTRAAQISARVLLSRCLKRAGAFR